MRRFWREVGRFLGETGILIGAAFLHALAFPNFLNAAGWGFLACFTMIPFFWVIDRAHWRVVWLEGAIYGFVFYLVYNYWLKTFHPLAILIAPSLEALQYLLLFPILKLGHTLPRRRGYLLQTLLYVTYSFLTQQGFLGYPYGNLASAFYAYPVLIQIVSITGVWGLVFLMAAPQSWIASFLNRRITLRESRVDMVVYAVLVAFQLVFGLVSYHHYEKATPSRTFRIAAVQHSADSWKGGYETYKANYQVLKNASVEALQAKPDMILWSETAFVPSVSWHTEHPSNYLTSQLVDDFVSFGKSLPVPLVTGNPEGLVKDKDLPPFLEDGSWNWKTYNTVILFGGGNILGTYRKQHLVPFTEYFPYEKEFPALYALLKANDYKWWEKGTEATVFSYDGVRFSTPICFEDIFGSLNATFVRNGADMLVNLTNDSWSGSVPAEMQHLGLAVFRAVENRRPLIRGTNSGITCLVTPSGKIIDPMEPFTKGWRLYEVPLGQKQGMTFYTRFPDLFASLAMVVSVVLLLSAIVHRRQDKRRSRYDHLFDESVFWDE
jgi:apolipoprotein N-acyltransferase